MKVLGAILGGGRSLRFGSDKALALLDGLPLIEHVCRAVAPQVETLVSCGRDVAGLETLADRPEPGLGPLGGLNAALHAAAARGFDAVLSIPCDAPDLPADLLARLAGAGPAYVAELPVVGFWPAALCELLDSHIAEEPRRSMRSWCARASARPVSRPGIGNINTPADLARLAKSRGDFRASAAS